MPYRGKGAGLASLFFMFLWGDDSNFSAQRPQIHGMATDQQRKFAIYRAAQNFPEIVNFTGAVVGNAHFERDAFLKCLIRSKLKTASLGKMEFSS